MEYVKLEIGDIVTMKKTHPCGSSRFEVTRTGVDVKLRCCGCGRVYMDERQSVLKKIKSVEKKENEICSTN